MKKDFREGTLITDSYIRPDKIATLDQQMITKALGTLTTAKISEVKSSLQAVFELL